MSTEPPLPGGFLSLQHARPFVLDDGVSRSLHFTRGELQSRMRLDSPCGLEVDYTRTMMGFLLFNPAPAHIGMIGLGGGSLAKFCYRYLPATRIKVIEINPHVIALRDQFSVPPDDERFRVRRGDGAEFVRFPPYRMDILLVDGFDDQGQPPALCSQRFYDDCFDALQPNGMMVANLHTGHRNFDSQVARIERTFGNEVLFIGDADHSNTIAFACKGLLLNRFKPAALRKPRSFDRLAWDELKPALLAVASGAAVAAAAAVARVAAPSRQR